MKKFKELFFGLTKTLKLLVTALFFIVFIVGTNLVSADEAEVQGKNVIPIAMATDNNYVYPTLISMTSAIENKNKDTFLEFYIMLSGKVTGENKEKFKKIVNKYKNCSVELIDMRDKFSSARTLGNITTPAYYRLNLPSLLPQYDKIIYIDGDLIVTKDLLELYNTDINNYYVGGVLDVVVSQWSDYCDKLGISDMSQYINTGVLLMNVKKMREDNIEKMFDDYIPTYSKRKLSFHDQDAINAICFGKIKLLDPTYGFLANVFSIYEQPRPASLVNVCSEGEWLEARKNPTIIHWAGSPKPWNSQNVRFYDKWNKYRNIVEKLLYPRALNDGIYTITSALNDWRVLDISNSSTENGANLQLWDDNGTDAQTFRIKYIGEGYYEIEALCSGKMIDVEYSGKSPGTNVWQYERNGTDAQKWLIKKADDDGSGYYYIISKCNGLSLDVKFSEIAPGTNVWVWERNGTNAQKFKFAA